MRASLSLACVSTSSFLCSRSSVTSSILSKPMRSRRSFWMSSEGRLEVRRPVRLMASSPTDRPEGDSSP